MVNIDEVIKYLKNNDYYYSISKDCKGKIEIYSSENIQIEPKESLVVKSGGYVGIGT